VRAVGDFQLRGPSLMHGYFEDPDKTRETLSADGWLRTGDLGYLVDGNLFICGRKKDVIILNGRNYYPQDLEWVASRVEGVRPGGVAAFGGHKTGLDREAVVVVVETRGTDPDHSQMATSVRNEIQRAISLVVDDVVVVRPGTLPKTSSGKIQRSKARAMYEAGRLEPRGQDGKLELAKHLLDSQLAHLKLSIFGRAKTP
jgi:acyl-CoA synthetase (AMP-forming)/AMP-acid ligase II